MRLDKWLSHQGIGTRSEVRKKIKHGLVTVNGHLVKTIGENVVPGQDHVVCEGQEVIYQEFFYLMLNKPEGCVTATEDGRHKTVLDYIDDPRKNQLFPVGRLDIDTTGLVFLTNDGQMSHRLLAPNSHVDKVYHACVDGPITQAMIEHFQSGITLDDGYVTKAAKLRVLEKTQSQTLAEVIIQEGKFHQIKRMFADVKLNVLSLKRLQMGSLNLDPELEEGFWRELKEEEIQALKKDIGQGL